MFCTSCGNQLKDGAKFCTKCGKEQKVKSAPKAVADPGLTSKPEPDLQPAQVTGNNVQTDADIYDKPESSASNDTGKTKYLWDNASADMDSNIDIPVNNSENNSSQTAYQHSYEPGNNSQKPYSNQTSADGKNKVPLIPIIALAAVAFLLVCTAGVLGFVFRYEIMDFVSGSKKQDVLADFDDEDFDIFEEDDEDESFVTSEEPADVLEDTGDTLTIECWNDEWQTRVINLMPGYTQDGNNPNHGHIGDLAVEWIVTPSDMGGYQNNLDKDLTDANKDVDIFLIEADYAGKYAVQGVAKPLSELGITDEDLANQYEYTKQIVTTDGVLYGTSWQTCGGGMIYNRAIAQKVLGTDDPDAVQDAVSDWEKWFDVAKQMKKSKYKMVPTVNFTERVFYNNKFNPYVSKDGKVEIDAQMLNWVAYSKLLADGKMAGTFGLWDTNEDFQKNKSFCVFGPSWYFNFCMQAGSGDSIADKGGWGFCKGPQAFFWGGTWICVADKTDNAKTAADVLRYMTTDEQILRQISRTYGDDVNNRVIIAECANDDSRGNYILGGQNPYKVYEKSLEEIHMEHYTVYDQMANEILATVMQDYFEGKCNQETAENNFYNEFLSVYPELHR